VIHTPTALFQGSAIQWRVREAENCAQVEAILIPGDEEFDVYHAQDIAIAAGLEVLPVFEKPVTGAPTIEVNREAGTLASRWGSGDAQLSLLTPTKPVPQAEAQRFGET
jgi:hypothetical protein